MWNIEITIDKEYSIYGQFLNEFMVVILSTKKCGSMHVYSYWNNDPK